MHRTRFAVAFLLAALAAPGAAHAQDATDILTGRVVDEFGQPVSNAVVEVFSLMTEITRSTLTDDDGKYVLLFPDGGGQYEMVVSGFGLAETTLYVAREGVEEVLITQVTLAVEGVEVAGLDVSARRAPPGAGNAGTRAINLPQRLLDRLPLPDLDPAMIAALAPNVILTAGDTASDLASFSVAGQRDALNQVTLDGGSVTSVLGSQGGGLGLPEEGVRATQVVTSTYDVSRGQFSGGLVSMTSARGVNRVTGSSSYYLQDPSLGSGNGAFVGGGTSQHRVSGGIGGPIRENKLFYNVSFNAQRRADDLFALIPENELDILPLNANPDSIARFLDILSNGYGVGLDGQTGQFDRTGDGISLMGRMDFELTERHSVLFRANGSVFEQDNAMISPTELFQNGGTMGTDSYGAQLGVTSRLGGAWINQFRTNLTGGGSDRSPYAIMPEGRVELGSQVGGPATGLGGVSGGRRGGAGGLGLSTLVFGGDGSMPSVSDERTLEVSDELSFLLGFTHRLKVGALFKSTSFSQESGANTLGRFTFPSLEALEQQAASSFSRSLAPTVSGARSVAGAVYVGDTWRPSDPLQITVGVRAEHTSYDTEMARDATIENVFGRRTDLAPSEWHMSPRVGFSYRLSERGAPLQQLTGGIGDFRGQAPLTLFGGTVGDLATQARLLCVGSAVPTPEWDVYRQDLGAIPSTCLGGVIGTPEAVRSPNVDVISPSFTAPRSWRASLGYQTQVGARFTASAEMMYTRGVSLYGIRDLNLDLGASNPLNGEGGRLFYGDPGGIVPATGEVSFASSRVDPAFGHVFEVYSEQESSTKQATLGLGALVRNGTIFQANYTLTKSSDQSSFSSGRATQGFSQTVTSGNPNEPGWAPSAFERRHSFTTYLIHPVNSWLDMSLIGRLNSGAPFTPMVSGDVNGDGVRNDAAFIFDPAVASPALAAGMTTVLENAPDAIRRCLEDQLGMLAVRNSCRDGWQTSLDVSATLRPNLPFFGLDDRFSIQVDLQNALAGVDHLIHSDADLAGWGVTNRVDRNLLRPVGFDEDAGRFEYTVNERFGQAVGSGGGGRGGFGGGGFRLYVTGRIALGANIPGFGGGGGGGRGGFGGRGGGGGFGGAGRGGGGFGGARGGIGGGRGGLGGGFGGGLRGLGRGLGGRGGGRGALDVSTLIDRSLANPIPVLLELGDTLGLTDDQVAQIEMVSAALEAELAIVAEDLRGGIDEQADPQAAIAALREIQPRLVEGREAITRAMKAVQNVLTDDQWDMVPAALKNPVGRGIR